MNSVKGLLRSRDDILRSRDDVLKSRDDVLRSRDKLMPFHVTQVVCFCMFL